MQWVNMSSVSKGEANLSFEDLGWIKFLSCRIMPICRNWKLDFRANAWSNSNAGFFQCAIRENV